MTLKIKRTFATLAILLAFVAPSIASGRFQSQFAGDTSISTRGDCDGDVGC